MNIEARQGDLVIRKATQDGGEFQKEQNAVIAGSAGSEHRIAGVNLIRREGDRTVVRVLEPTQLIHGNRHLPVNLSPGDYVITRLRERGDGRDRAVED